jgi:hypothetical protein
MTGRDGLFKAANETIAPNDEQSGRNSPSGLMDKAL